MSWLPDHHLISNIFDIESNNRSFSNLIYWVSIWNEFVCYVLHSVGTLIMMAGLWSFSPDLRYAFWNRCSHYSCLTWWLYQTSSLDHFNDDNLNFRPFLLTPHNFCVLWHNGLFPISLVTFRFLYRWLVSLKCDKGWINHTQLRYDQSLFSLILIVNAFDHMRGFRWLDICELSGPFPYIMIAPMYVVYPHCIILPFHRMILAKLWLNKWVWVLMTH